MIHLTPHFTLAELTYSAWAERHEVDNTPARLEIDNLTYLCREALEPLRVAVGRPLIVTSGYRCRRVNMAAGGVPQSYHLQGRAADIVCRMMSPADLAAKVKALHLPYTELIIEPSWLHIAL